MNEKRSPVLPITIAGFILGIAGDQLLRQTPWGINIVLFAVAIAAGCTIIAKMCHITFDRGAVFAGCASVYFIALLAWRDSTDLTEWNISAALLFASIAALRARKGSLVLATVLEYPIGVIQVWITSLVGVFPLVFREIPWMSLNEGKSVTARLAGVVRGTLLTIPVVGIFGGLLVQADPVYSNLVGGLFRWDFASLIWHIVFTFLFACLGAGILRSLLAKEWKPLMPFLENRSKLGTIETCVVLWSIALLFFSFVVVQFGYFFGGSKHVHSVIGMTYQEYARSGFFQLVTVTSLVLPLLLFLHWLYQPDDRREQILFAAGSTAVIAMLFVIIYSAWCRVQLYVATCGLTADRLYASAGILWIGVVCILFMATVLRNQRDRFAFGAVVSGALFLVGLNVMNPNNYIVQVNLRGFARGQYFNAYYASSLGSDAMPALIDAFPRLSLDQKQNIATAALADRANNGTDWRTWNVSRMLADEYITAHEAKLAPFDTPPAHQDQ